MMGDVCYEIDVRLTKSCCRASTYCIPSSMLKFAKCRFAMWLDARWTYSSEIERRVTPLRDSSSITGSIWQSLSPVMFENYRDIHVCTLLTSWVRS